ncbi:MAG: hypothetical protein ACJ8F3_01615 [Xanthobacteraceae bacterium]
MLDVPPRNRIFGARARERAMAKCGPDSWLREGSLVCAMLGTAAIMLSAFLVGYSLWYIAKFAFHPLFWDQWELVRYLASSDFHDVIFFLFARHNEHVIATSKLLYLLDYALFDLTNIFVLVCSASLQIANALLLVSIVFSGYPKNLTFWTALAVLSALTLSLSQWENLIWAFQSPFPLVVFFAICTLWSAVRYHDSLALRGAITWLGVLVLGMAACVFTLGGGAVIPFAVAALLLRLGSPISKLLAAVVMGLLLVTALIYILGNNTGASLAGGIPLPAMVARFFVVMIGAPLAQDPKWGAIIGSGLLLVVAAVFFACRSSRDRPILILMALVLFLLGNVAAAAATRSSFGIGTAMSPRYSTPILVLWGSVLATGLRAAIIGQRRILVFLSVSALLLVAGISTLRPTPLEWAQRVHRQVAQAGYFAVSGVKDPALLATLYPSPQILMPLLDYLQRQQLNIFSPKSLFPAPTALEILAASHPDASLCQYHAIEAMRVHEHTVEVNGWLADNSNHEPRFVLLLDGERRLIGFTQPLVERSQVIPSGGAASDLPGFRLAAPQPSTSDGFLVAIGSPPHAICRLPILLR